jgi:hypothetical protein
MNGGTSGNLCSAGMECQQVKSVSKPSSVVAIVGMTLRTPWLHSGCTDVLAESHSHTDPLHPLTPTRTHHFLDMTTLLFALDPVHQSSTATTTTIKKTRVELYSVVETTGTRCLGRECWIVPRSRVEVGGLEARRQDGIRFTCPSCSTSTIPQRATNRPSR